MKWAVSLVARRTQGSVVTYNHTVCLVVAASKDEAVGKGLRLTGKAYKQAEGWEGHHAVACADTNVLDPDMEGLRLVEDG